MQVEAKPGPVVITRLPALGIVFEGGRRCDLQPDEALPVPDGLLAGLLLDLFEFIGQRALFTRCLFVCEMAHRIPCLADQK
ncbi:MAG: hypothetical protein U9Q75_10200 [Pseudomonadota bacterium]|nr:hypothetical protein [Pseudomonadota bacterium]